MLCNPYKIFNKRKKETFFNSKKSFLIFHKSKNIFLPTLSKINNIILFAFIFLSSIKNTSQDRYIAIKVNTAGENQIISNEYSHFPSTVYVGNTRVTLNNRKISVSSTDQLIKLRWSSHTFDNYSKMFKGLTNIVYAEIYEMFYDSDNGINLSYMFCGCTNLRSMASDDSYIEYISSMEGMFSGCTSLTSVNLERFLSVSYYINLSYMFYNCQRLTYIRFFHFYYIRVSNAREMFYNCISLGSFTFKPYHTSSPINMNKMFYNCTAITSIEFSVDKYCVYYNGHSCYYRYYYDPSDMSFMFYNCHSLVSLTLNYFSTESTQYMSYMLYNCKRLTYFKFNNKYYKTFYQINNKYVKDMRGLFQNCESLVTLNLSFFHTSSVQIMWDMFKGCKNLKYLNISHFDTSSVTDMQSMFNGCSNLVTLNLSHFYTSKVQYMNKMFQNCESLQVLILNKATTESLGTMHRMFYNCKNLRYLNIFKIVEDVQSIAEIFEGTYYKFKLCIYDERNIPNIMKILDNKPSIQRDCSQDCYGANTFRQYSSINKHCCENAIYNNICYNKCPGRTKKISSNSIICDYFPCSNYYKYEQDGCLNTISHEYFLNDSNLHTIDKCDSNCYSCEKRPTKCTNCYSDNIKKFLNLSKCIETCKYGYFTDNNAIKKCFCHEQKCKECSEESLELNLCVSCNIDKKYYPKLDETFTENNFINCYQNPEEYYLDSYEKIYKPCYPSCKYCDRQGDKYNHYCFSCNSKNTYPFIIKENSNYINCYPNCTFNFYFDDYFNYTCHNTTGCPDFAPLLIDKTKQCAKNCTKKNKYIFRSTCFETCPIESIPYSNITGYYCNSVCPFERPFEMVLAQICVSYCTIMERYNGLCVTNYEGNRSAKYKIWFYLI